MSSIVSPLQVYRPLYADAYEALRDAILDGRLPSGERIVEAEIARQMAISRGPIREAIRKLEQDGLVEHHPRRGVVVVELSTDEVLDVYRLRAHLEAYGIRLAAPRATNADLDLLDDLIGRMRDYAARDDPRPLINTDVEFHRSICRLSGSKPLLRLWESLNPHCWTLLTSLKATEYGLSDIAERHCVVLDALRSRDPDRAEAEIRRHIVELAEHVVAHISTEDAATPERRPPAGNGRNRFGVVDVERR